MLMHTDRRRGNPVAIQKFAGFPGILTGHMVTDVQHPECAQSNVCRIPDRKPYNIVSLVLFHQYLK